MRYRRIILVLFSLGLFALTATRVWAAVTVSSFTAHWQGSAVKVEWTTASEYDNLGFNLLRSTEQNGTYSQLNANIIPSKCIGCVAGASYAFIDTGVSAGQAYFYKLQPVGTDGPGNTFGPVQAIGSAATNTPTATTVPPTATRTVVPTKTKTKTPTSTFTALPTATATGVLDQSVATTSPTSVVTSTPVQPTFAPSPTEQPVAQAPLATGPDNSSPDESVAPADSTPAELIAPADSSQTDFPGTGSETPDVLPSASPTADSTSTALQAVQTPAPTSPPSNLAPSSVFGASDNDRVSVLITAAGLTLGVLGSVAFAALVGFLFWYLRRA